MAELRGRQTAQLGGMTGILMVCGEKASDSCSSAGLLMSSVVHIPLLLVESAEIKQPSALGSESKNALPTLTCVIAAIRKGACSK